MKKLYEKNELTFALVWIVIYCVLQSLANPLNEMIGIEYSASAAFCILQAVVLFAFIRKNNLLKMCIRDRWKNLFMTYRLEEHRTHWMQQSEVRVHSADLRIGCTTLTFRKNGISTGMIAMSK